MISSQTPAANRLFLSSVPVITGKLTDGQRVGTWVYHEFTFGATPNTDTTFTHNLGRIPNGLYLIYSKTGGMPYGGSNNRTDWTATQIVLRCMVASEFVGVLIC